MPDEMRSSRNALRARVGGPLEIDDGWIPLVTRLLDAIDAVGLDYEVAQVKEKFGGLRFYWHPKSDTLTDEQELLRDRVDHLVSTAEDESVLTCEVCGAPGRRRTGGWIRTLCDGHDGGNG